MIISSIVKHTRREPDTLIPCEGDCGGPSDFVVGVGPDLDFGGEMFYRLCEDELDRAIEIHEAAMESYRTNPKFI